MDISNFIINFPSQSDGRKFCIHIKNQTILEENHFWAPEYYVDTIDLDEEMIRRPV